jgi:hypothetical protein
MESVRDRISLDWLKQARSQQGFAGKDSRSGLPSGLEDALIAYGGVLLRGLREQPEKTDYLQPLIERLGLRLSDALPVVEHLISRGDIEKLKDDPSGGNYLLKLTSKGEALPLGQA